MGQREQSCARRKRLQAALRAGRVATQGKDRRAQHQVGKQRLQRQMFARIRHERANCCRVTAEAPLIKRQRGRQPAHVGIVFPGLHAETGHGPQQLPVVLEAVLVLAIARHAAGKQLERFVVQSGSFRFRAHSPSASLAIMLRWISLEPP